MAQDACSFLPELDDFSGRFSQSVQTAPSRSAANVFARRRTHGEPGTAPRKSRAAYSDSPAASRASSGVAYAWIRTAAAVPHESRATHRRSSTRRARCARDCPELPPERSTRSPPPSRRSSSSDAEVIPRLEPVSQNRRVIRRGPGYVPASGRSGAKSTGPTRRRARTQSSLSLASRARSASISARARARRSPATSPTPTARRLRGHRSRRGTRGSARSCPSRMVSSS